MKNVKDITIIGAGIIDVPCAGADEEVFHQGTFPVRSIQLSFGGDALNESVILSRLGLDVDFISRIGDDEAGRNILSYLKRENVSDEHVKVDPLIPTGINIVLIDNEGERFFLTNPNGSLRKLCMEDILPHLDQMAGIVSFASLFVSPLLSVPAMKELFASIKESGRTLCVDMTKPKQNETFDDVKELFPYMDYFFPNSAEISQLTGESDPYKNGRLLVDAGVGCAVIKIGKEGSLIFTEEGTIHIPAYLVESVDTTGAGDSYAAGFMYGLRQGWNLQECGCFASAVSSCIVEKIGTVQGVQGIEESMRRYRILIDKCK